VELTDFESHSEAAVFKIRLSEECVAFYKLCEKKKAGKSQRPIAPAFCFMILRLKRKSVSCFCTYMRDAENSMFLSLFRISNLTEKTEAFGQALITDNADNQANYIELPLV
jgi:hypothetical protein